MEIDFEEILKASERHIAKSQELQERASAIVGRAQTDDGRIIVDWTGDGISGLTIDPRAMRLGSDVLAAEIMKTATLAKEDQTRRQQQLREEVLGPDEFDPISAIPDTEAVQSTVQQMQDMINGTVNDTSAILDQLRKFTGR